jgi:hypothetical protein
MVNRDGDGESRRHPRRCPICTAPIDPGTVRVYEGGEFFHASCRSWQRTRGALQQYGTADDGPMVEAMGTTGAHPNPKGRRFSAGAQSVRSPRPSSEMPPTRPRMRWTGVRAVAMSWPRRFSNGDCRALPPRSGLSWWRHCKDIGPWADTPGSPPATGGVSRADWSFDARSAQRFVMAGCRRTASGGRTSRRLTPGAGGKRP